ncbi:hypothetical protein BOTCAL_0163g00010 [Botryotinia calthae]|uniref:Uncharacterized protein n=1 Tax=Botryotinia calthae TaxID=38488 RepID=A0A4Y8D1L9_9HELO|nr:hypothetical protein BOTCAL_0163g00010 [Botryotinia calthae]
MNIPQNERFECSRGHLHEGVEAYDVYCARGCPDHCGCYQHTSKSGRKTQQLARRERRVSEKEERLSEEEARLENMRIIIQALDTVVSMREAALRISEEGFERKKNELLATGSRFDRLQDWCEDASTYAQDGSSYGSYGRESRSDSNGSLQLTHELDSGEIPRRHPPFYSDHSMRPHDAPSHRRRSGSVSQRHSRDSNQPTIRITPPDADLHSVSNDWGSHYEY